MYAVAALHSYVVLSMAYFDCFAAVAATTAAVAAVASLRQWPAMCAASSSVFRIASHLF